MKYSEFNHEVANLGYVVSPQERNTYIERDGELVAQVSRLCPLRLSTNFAEFSDLQLCDQIKIVALCVQLAETPLAEREEEKRYRLRLASKLFAGSTENIYLNQNLQAPDRYCVNSNFNGLGMKTIFTESEIAEMDITGFEKVEVS